MRGSSTLLDRIVDAGEGATPARRALLEERYAALRRQIPLLYLIGLANLAGVHLASNGSLAPFRNPVTPMLALVVVRLAYWLWMRRRPMPPERIPGELRKTFFYALAFSVSFCIWAVYQLLHGHSIVVLFGVLAAVGCAYGLSCYVAAARLPLLLLGLPLAGCLVLSGEPGHMTMGFSLCLTLLLILHLLQVHDRAFERLVESRAEIAAERERAQQAERAAKAEKAKARKIADTDPLTGLANRRAFLRELGRHSAALQRGAPPFALAIVDLDGFKPINDTFGHATGDAVLQAVAGRLKEVGGTMAVAARMGGDEFAVLVPAIATSNAALAVGTTIRTLLERPFLVDGREFRISGCCGLTLLSQEESDVTQALIRADTALYAAKHKGRAGVAVFSEALDAANRRRVEIEDALRSRPGEAAIELVYQPIRDLATGELRAFEALARWEHPSLGRIGPTEFIPVAEQINLIGEISERLLASAAAEAMRWAEAIRLSFNVSAVQLCTEGSADRLLAILARSGLDPARLQLEVTETALLVDFEAARTNLQALRGAGARIFLDDFGAGHASISYLREMQFDGVKLDGGLIGPITESVRSRRLLKGVVDLCAAIGLPTVAEHIETRAQLELLRELGCRDGQGYLLSPPVDPEAAAALAAPRLIVLAGAARRGR